MEGLAVRRLVGVGQWCMFTEVKQWSQTSSWVSLADFFCVVNHFSLALMSNSTVLTCTTSSRAKPRTLVCERAFGLPARGPMVVRPLETFTAKASERKFSPLAQS